MQATLSAHTPGAAGNFVNVDGCPACDVEPHWVVIGETYGAGRRRIAVFNRWVMTLDARGKVLRHLAQPVPWAPLALQWRCSQGEAQARFLLMGVAQRRTLQEALRDEVEQAFLFCLALMHCNDVEEVELPPSPPPVIRKRQRQNPARLRRPETRYKTLTVTPSRAAAAQGATAGENGTNGAGEAESKALHFVRWHFKDYSVKGLFGKYKKVYWWDSQVRGEVMGGVVDKEYQGEEGVIGVSGRSRIDAARPQNRMNMILQHAVHGIRNLATGCSPKSEGHINSRS